MAFLFAEAKEDATEGGDMFANPRMARMMRPAMRIMMNGLMKVSALMAVVAVHLRTPRHTLDRTHRNTPPHASHTAVHFHTHLAHRSHLHTPRTRGGPHPAQVTTHDNDCTQKEVASFMVPSSVGKPFKDAPGTFDPSMPGRIKDVMMGGMMVMHRKVMEAGPEPHNKVSPPTSTAALLATVVVSTPLLPKLQPIPPPSTRHSYFTAAAAGHHLGEV